MNETPKGLFDAAVAALAAEDWFALAGLCDPHSLERFRSGMVRQYTREPSSISVDDYLRHAPDMPREVAEYHISVVEKNADPRARFREDLPTVQSIGDLTNLSPREVYAAWLHARSPRVQLERQVEAGQVPREAIENMLSESRSAPLRFVGVVMEGDRLAHVLYRWAPVEGEGGEADCNEEGTEEFQPQDDGPYSIPPQLVRCRRHESGEWHLLADYSLFGFGSTMYYVGKPEENDDSD